jgi:hypothetical protein
MVGLFASAGLAQAEQRVSRRWKHPPKRLEQHYQKKP